MPKQRFTVFALFMVILIDALGWGVAFPVLDPIILKNTAHMLDASTSLANRNFLYELALAIYCIFMFLMSPILGALSDKHGRKSILIISMMGNFVGFFVSAIAIPMHSYLFLLLGRSIAGATAGSLPIAQAAIMDISDEQQKASRLGLVVLGNVVGFALGPVIGAFFMDQNIFTHVNYQTPFYISCVMGLLGALMIAFFFKETYQGDKNLRINPATSIMDIYHAFTQKQTFRYCLVLFCFLFGWGMFFSTMPILLSERLGWVGSSVGFFIAYVASVFAFVILVILPKLTQKFPLPKIIFSSLIILFITNIIFPLQHNSISPWFVILLAIAVPFIYVGTVTLLSMQVNNQEQGKIMGVAGSIFAFTWGFGPILAGYSLRGGLTTPYILIGIFLFLGILVMSFHKKES